MTSNSSMKEFLGKYEGKLIKADNDDQLDQFFVFEGKLHYIETGAAQVCEQRGIAPEYINEQETIILTDAPRGGSYNALKMEKILDDLGINALSNPCGVLAKNGCDMEKEISIGYSKNNIFLDIPYKNYDDCENILNEVLGSAGLNPLTAKGKVTSQAMLCKICKIIKTCKYGVTDISSGSNSVSYEYGLMHGFGMNVALLMRENTDKFSDITGIEHLQYSDLRSLKSILSKWLIENVSEANKEYLQKILSDEEAAIKQGNIKPYKLIRQPLDDSAGSSGHIEIPSSKNKSSIYFQFGEVLVKREEMEVAYEATPLLYLRLIPISIGPTLKMREVKEIVYGIKIAPLRSNIGDGASWGLNRYGGITYSFEKRPDGKHFFATSQVFLNREIWGIDSTLLAGEEAIQVAKMEQIYELALKQYLDVANKLLNLEPPLIVEAGMTDVKDFTMYVGHNYLESSWGPIQVNEIKSRQTLSSLERNAVNNTLLAIFEEFFDAIGESRPANFAGFPPKDPG